MKATCPECKKDLDVTPRTRGKVTGSAVGALIGRAVSRHWLVVLLGAAAGAVVGHYCDEDRLERCPTCGGVRDLTKAVGL